MNKLYILISTLFLTSCEGLFDGIYDKVPEEQPGEKVEVKEGQIVVDATSWTEWHYIDLERSEGEVRAVTIDVPLETADTQQPGEHPAGIYTYWYDVFGEGIRRNEYRSFSPTLAQPEPEHWTLALHRNNVRTNGGAACRTPYTSINELPSKEALANASFTPDTWNENWVWVAQDRMLSGIIGCQGICINPVLSSWLEVNLPPIPPSFTHDKHVFLLRTASGELAALQLQNYMNAAGTKCHLTINYRFPL